MKYFITLCLFLLIGCSHNDSGVSDKSTESDSIVLPDSEVRTAEIFVYEKGDVKAEIKADKILKFDKIDSTQAYVLDINILDTLGTVSTNIVGDSGVIREAEGILHIYSNVVVFTSDSTKLETEYLWWDSNTNRIKSDQFVRITKHNDVITGYGLDADNELNSIKILNQVSGEVNDAEKLESDK